MTVLLWSMEPDIENTILDMGFTHQLRVHPFPTPDVWKKNRPLKRFEAPRYIRDCGIFNDWMKKGLRACVVVDPGRRIKNYPAMGASNVHAYNRIDRKGKVVSKRNPNVAHPDIQKFGYNTGVTFANNYLHFPYFDSVLCHSEIRDGSQLSFQPYDIKAAEKFIGGPIPAQAINKNGVPYRNIRNFPADRIIPDNFPLLRFYEWFWRDGDGWNPLETEITKGLKSTGRKDFWTFFDPAVRVPSLWGSGGQVDVVSQWTYSYPDPIKTGQACDELFAMAEGTPGQEVMKMVQLIWYRNNETAPVAKLPQDPAKRNQWEKELPKTRFITISPDHLEIAIWSMLSRPVKGIMFHGAGAVHKLPPMKHQMYYPMANNETAPRLKKLLNNIVKPLGATLKMIPDAPTRIALLESFSSQIFAQRGSFGWSASWEADMHLILQWAGYQPKIIYDETIRKYGLNDYDVLVMPSCDVLTKSVYDEIVKFQQRGGIIVADERLAPALMADILVPVYRRKLNNAVDKKELQQRAVVLRNELDPFFKRTFKTSNLDLVGRIRRFGDADYFFLINDKRTYGKYVGHYGKVMENGVANSGTVTLNGAAHIYELSAKKKVAVSSRNGENSFEVNMNAGEGKLFMQIPSPLDKMTLDAPETVNIGSKADVIFRIICKNGKQPKAVIPFKVTITDSFGKPAEFSGYHAAVNGELKLQLNIAPNEKAGQWHIAVEDLAAGLKASAVMEVK